MHKMTSHHARLRVMALALILASCATGLTGDRESAMEGVDDANKSLLAMAESGAFDQAAVNEEARVIATKLEVFQGLFPAGSESAGGAAKATIWTDPAGFEAAGKDAHDAAVELAAVTDAATFAIALDTLQGTCKACHTKYRASK